MKKLGIILGSVVIMSLFSACEKRVGRIVMRGEWKISEYIEDGDNETNKFASYKFDFMGDKRVEATGNDGVFIGTWDEAFNDGESKFYLTFGSGPLVELNDDWVVVERTRTTIRLIDDSDPGEILEFRKQ